MSDNTNVSSFATIGEVFEDGVSLIFDGQEEATEKHYRVNTSIFFSAGDRVKILPDSGTYVVEYVVGSPKKEKVAGLPKGGASGQVLTKQSGTDYAADWQTPANPLPEGGSTGQVLAKDSGTDHDVSWQTPKGSMPSGGSSGQVLTKTAATDYSASWKTPENPLPTGGSANQVLMKSSATNYAVKWANAPTPSMAAGVENQYRTGNESYRIQFQTDYSGSFYIRSGTGSWKKITVG